MLGILPFLILGGIGYAGYLAYGEMGLGNNEEWKPEIQKEVPQEKKVSLVDFDEDRKIKNVIDPFAGQLPDVSKIIHGYAEMEDGSEYHIFGYNTNGLIPMTNFKIRYNLHCKISEPFFGFSCTKLFKD
jgi:hypothetical protein